MKLPFSLSLKFVFRLLLPGFVVSLALVPVLQVSLASLSVSFPVEWAFLLLAIVLGWLFIVLDMHIYMLFEGRRYWPGSIKQNLMERERQRLDRLLSTVQNSKHQDRARYLEASVDLRRYPMDENGIYTVEAPTRIGNLILAYEGYPGHRYGMDAVFFWPRLWLLLTDDQRKDIDDQQALADSALYCTAALFFDGIVCLCYFVAALLGVGLGGSLPHSAGLAALAVVCFFAGYGIYRMSLELHATFGETFKATFDVLQRRLDLSVALDHIRREWPEALPSDATSKEEYTAAWRYLHNFRVRVGGKSVPATGGGEARDR